MLTTNFAKIHAENGSAEIYKKLAEALGGVSRYGQNTPITLDIIVESIGLADAVWAMRCANEPPFNLLLEFACRCAERRPITRNMKPIPPIPRIPPPTPLITLSPNMRLKPPLPLGRPTSPRILPPITPTGSSIRQTPLTSRRWLPMSLTLRIPTGRLMILN